MFETLIDLFVTSPLNFCCIGSPPTSPRLTPRVVVTPPPPRSTSVAIPSVTRGPYALQVHRLSDKLEMAVVVPPQAKVQTAVVINTNVDVGDEEKARASVQRATSRHVSESGPGCFKRHGRHSSKDSSKRMPPPMKRSVSMAVSSNHQRQASVTSINSVLGEEMKRGYVRAIWLLEGGGTDEAAIVLD